MHLCPFLFLHHFLPHPRLTFSNFRARGQERDQFKNRWLYSRNAVIGVFHSTNTGLIEVERSKAFQFLWLSTSFLPSPAGCVSFVCVSLLLIYFSLVPLVNKFLEVFIFATKFFRVHFIELFLISISWVTSVCWHIVTGLLSYLLSKYSCHRGQFFVSHLSWHLKYFLYILLIIFYMYVPSSCMYVYVTFTGCCSFLKNSFMVFFFFFLFWFFFQETIDFPKNIFFEILFFLSWYLRNFST